MWTGLQNKNNVTCKIDNYPLRWIAPDMCNIHSITQSDKLVGEYKVADSIYSFICFIVSTGSVQRIWYNSQNVCVLGRPHKNVRHPPKIFNQLGIYL